MASQTSTATPESTTLSDKVLKDCNFEDENLCGWNIDFELNATEYFEFHRSTGDLNLGSGAGPLEDHDGEKNSKTRLGYVYSNIAKFSEYFLWADAILGTPLSETSLSSPVVDTFQKVCFSFWYDLSVCKLYELCLPNLYLYSMVKVYRI